MDSGVVCNGVELNFPISVFVCDAPARAFLKGIKGHTAYSACERCCQSGVWNGKMTYPEVNAIKRTDVAFYEMQDPEHHNTRSPLSDLGIGMVSQFVIDYMHLVCLGVVRRLLLIWLRGPLPLRLPARSVAEVSARLISLRQHTPCEFARKPRSLTDIDRWKATEFRQFVLFTGPVVLKKILPDQLYNNFVLLHVAITCLLSPTLCSLYVDFSEKLLKKFVLHGIEVYGEEFSVYNVHNLIHLADDARQFGPLDNVSCFPFENLLGQVKRLVRSPHLPLQQVINRICERQSCNIKQVSQPQPSFPCLKRVMHTDFCVPNFEGAVFYSCLQTKDYTLKLNDSDSCVELIDNNIGRIQYIFLHSDVICVVLRLYDTVECFYSYPLKSDLINVVCLRNLSTNLNIYKISDIKNKCYCMPMQNESCLAIPLGSKP